MIPTPASLRRGALALATFLFALSAVAFAADETRTFDVPAGRAAQTLKQFAAQAGREIVYAPEAVGEVQTNAIQGALVPKDALDRMLANTVLVGTQDQTGAFAVSRRAGPNVMAAAAGDPPPAGAGQLVKLSPFTVSGEVKGRYEAVDESSGSRIRTSLMDAPQSITVITHELVEDVGATRILDAAKYAAGISESTIPNAQDRTNLRGFQTDGATIDGFNFFSFSNLDPVIIDRLEVVKGPNALLSPQIVSGTINVVSKKPVFSNQGSADFEVGRYDADRAEFDGNQAVNGQLAVRIVGAAEHAHDQAAGNFNDSQVVMPMATYRFSPNAEVTAQAQIYNSYDAAYGGVPLDFTVGTRTPARIMDGIPESLDFYGTEIARHAQGQHFRLFFNGQPTEQLSVRLALNTIHWTGDSVGLSIGNPINPATGLQVTEMGQMVALDNNTGNWVPTGVNIANPVFNEQPTSGSWGFQTRRYLNLQNDYSYQVKFDADNQSTTLVGYMVDYLSNPGWAYNFTIPNMNVKNFVLAPMVVAPTVASDAYSIAWDQQVYASEQLSLLGDRIVASGSIAESSYRQYTSDLFHHTTSQNKVHANLPSAALVVKPIPQVALFADVTRQAQPNGTSPATGTNPTTTGKQYEFGVRAQLLDKRIYATLTYFNISQNNFSIPNQANATVPPPAVPFPPIFTDRKVKGVEFETTSAITDNLSIVGNIAEEHARTPLGQVFRGVADVTAAGFLNYTFDKTGAWKGLSAGVGVDYMSKRAGDNPSPSGFTANSTPGNLIIGQPSFWLPARTLVSAMISYKFDAHWRAQLNVDNLFDQDYLAASTSRNNVFPGTPINPRLTVTYKF